MNFILASVMSILYYTLFTFAKSVPGTSIANGEKPEEVTAVVNSEAHKDADNYDIKPIKTPLDKNRPVQTLDDIKEEAENDGLVPIAVLAVYASPKEIFDTPTPVFVAAQQYIEEAGSAGRPQNVRLEKEGDENSDDDKSKKTDDSESEKKVKPSTSETSNK